MPYIPHTADDVSAMLAEIDVHTISGCFDEIPSDLPRAALEKVPTGLNELEMSRLMQTREPKLQAGNCFIGAGAYEHYIPAAVTDILSRGEYYTAYTPYQAEASQGSLQLIYEYQSMMANVMAMNVSNASMYEGASALAESVLMAVRIKRHRAKRILVPNNIHPNYRLVLKTVLQHQDVIIEELPFIQETGQIDAHFLETINPDGLAAVIIPQPNFFGGLEEVSEFTDKAHQLGALVIALVNPMAMALLAPPGEWGEAGADIVCGEGQPLGVPLSSGGPYFGFMCCKQEYVRQIPGRLVGRTQDTQNRDGYTLTLQAREQHIRRAKATSNICTNQGLMVVAATVYMSLMGASGLHSAAAASHQRASDLLERLTTIEGVSRVFDAPVFHEFVIRLDKPVEKVLEQLLDFGLEGGFNLKPCYPQLGECMLVCATETKTNLDLERYQQLLSKCISQ